MTSTHAPREGAAALPTAGPRTLSPQSIQSDDIFEAAAACRDRFEEYLQEPRLFCEQVTELRRRFSTWAAFLGVFAPVKVCLDTRLANVPELKELVMSMLTVLRKNLARGIKRHRLIAQRQSDGDVSTETDGAMIGITGAMDRLGRLALVIRRSSDPSEVERVLAFARKREPDGFGNVILALVRSRFPSDFMTESLQVQLASSITHRRDRLMYQIRHEEKLRADRNDETVSETAPTGGPGNPWQAAPEALRGQLDLATGEATGAPLGTSIPLKQFLSRSLAMKPNNVSSVRSANPFVEAEYPKAPTLPPGHADAQCPICRRPQPRGLMEDEKRWRKHVDEDLRPYVCISEECGNIPPAFSTREEWRNHMNQKKHGSDWVRHIHRPHRWLCTLQHDELHFFESEDLLLSHLWSDHATDISDSRLAHIASKNKVPIPSEANTCPFCGEQVGLASGPKASGGAAVVTPVPSQVPPSYSDNSVLTGSRKDVLAKRMWKHIADHLEYLSLWSLRWWDDDSGVSAESRGLSELAEQALSNTSVSAESPAALEDRISAATVLSRFPHPNAKFIPADAIDSLVTTDSILEKLPGLFDSEDGVQLASYILGRAKRIFIITAVHCDLRWEELKAAIIRFEERDFGDTDLPIPDPSHRDQQEAVVPLSLPQSKWTTFYQSQWRYSAPVFTNKRFFYDLEPNHIIMPLTWVNTRAGDAAYAFEVHIHVAHQDYLKGVKSKAPISLALKELDPDGQDMEDMSRLSHPHLANALAAVKIGSKRYSMFHWAHGGSLREYWRTSRRPTLHEDLVIDVIDQLCGLADALEMLHGVGCRHGDLKPEKILRFESGTSLGRLSMYLTEHNVDFPYFATGRYAAPQIGILSQELPFPPDLWSLGCIILEFMIWLLYGWDELSKFHNSQSSFFQIREESNSQASVHPNIIAWMDHMAEDPECSGPTALGDLLRLVRERLLVLNIAAQPWLSLVGGVATRHATIHELLEGLRSILSNKGSVNGYFFTGQDRTGLVGYRAQDTTTTPSLPQGKDSAYQSSEAGTTPDVAMTDTLDLFPARLLQDCLDSLAFPEMHTRHMDIEDPMPETCEWLVHHEEYIKWANTDRGLLWIKGKPGSGKSTLLRYLLDHGEKEAKKELALSFFFDRRGSNLQMTPVGLLRSLLWQLLSQVPHFAELFELFEQSFEMIQKLGRECLWGPKEQSFFETSLSRVLVTQPVSLFIDALDECDQTINVVRYLTGLLEKLPRGEDFRICYTSRLNVTGWGPKFEICVEEENSDDIGTFVKDKHSSLRFSTTTANWVVQRATGVFLWAKLAICQVEAMMQRGATPGEIDDYIRAVTPAMHELCNENIDQDATKRLACPFQKQDPVRYDKCGHLRITSFGDVLQHLGRSHRLVRPNHCIRCRTRLCPPRAKRAKRTMDEHARRGCLPVSLIEAGQLTPSEFDDLKYHVRRHSIADEAKWFRAWDWMFEGTARPVSPYFESPYETQRRLAHTALPEILDYWQQGPRDVEQVANRLVDTIFRSSQAPTSMHSQLTAGGAGQMIPTGQYTVPPLGYTPLYTAEGQVVYMPNVPDPTHQSLMDPSLASNPQMYFGQQPQVQVAPGMSSFDSLYHPNSSYWPAATAMTQPWDQFQMNAPQLAPQTYSNQLPQASLGFAQGMHHNPGRVIGDGDEALSFAQENLEPEVFSEGKDDDGLPDALDPSSGSGSGLEGSLR